MFFFLASMESTFSLLKQFFLFVQNNL